MPATNSATELAALVKREEALQQEIFEFESMHRGVAAVRSYVRDAIETIDARSRSAHRSKFVDLAHGNDTSLLSVTASLQTPSGSMNVEIDMGPLLVQFLGVKVVYDALIKPLEDRALQSEIRHPPLLDELRSEFDRVRARKWELDPDSAPKGAEDADYAAVYKTMNLKI